MLKRIMAATILITLASNGYAQQESEIKPNQRLDFAKTYFELGSTFLPSFTGKTLIDNQIVSFKNSTSSIQYLTWGAFHFWGHVEFYVTIPLGYKPFQKQGETSSELLHSVATGARFFPWAIKENKIRPYFGVAWSSLDFKQKIKPDDNQTMLAKDFSLTYDAGVLYNYKSFAFRLGLNYFQDNTWQYPLSKTIKTEIKTPKFGLQLGLLYTIESSRKTDRATKDRWNSFPALSKASLGATKLGDFFIGVGPSLSFSLLKSKYNQTELPYLKDQLTSSNYFEISTGYHFYKAGLFTALSFRNPKFETKGFGTTQTIRKTSIAFEVNKFLIDYSGFAPYVGLNVAYDRLKYTESTDGVKKELVFKQNIEPGITIGWDIQPGKSEEALILRTNLRWFPFSSFAVEGKKFNFSQLEYNLIQAVFYPGRYKKKKK